MFADQDFEKNEHRLVDAMADALKRYQDTMGELFPVPVQCKLIRSSDFSAAVSEIDEGFLIEVSHGCIVEIETLWESAWQSPILSDEAGTRLEFSGDEKGPPAQLADASLTWLILHELMHIRLGHLEIIGAGALVETDVAGSVSIQADVSQNESLQHSQFKQAIEAALAPAEMTRLRPCLELQSDNDATDILLGVFKEENWPQFRIDGVSIFVIMSLIEKFNTKSSTTHPTAATRFFSLMAQIFQYWLYHPGAELYVDGDVSRVRTPEDPSGKEFDRYLKAVLIPLINDVVVVAMWAEAKTFLIDLGDESATFRDIYEAQYSPHLQTTEFRTNAAKQWRDLLPINEKIMMATGLRE